MGGVVSEGKVKIQIVWLSNCSVNARPIWGISCSVNVFVFDGFLSVNINNCFMVGLLFKTALYKMTSVCTFFINFQCNRQITKELFKSDLMKFWKIVDGFLICCVNFVNRRKGLKQFKEVNKLLFRLVTALEILVTTSRHALYNILLSDRICSQYLVLSLFNILLERILLMWRHHLYR